MNSRKLSFHRWRFICALFASLVFCALELLAQANPQPKQPTQSGQKGFANPEDAGRALVDAAEKYQVPTLLSILGADATDLVSSGDPVRDKARAAEFAELARKKQSISMEADGSATLIVGNEDWPFPIPIVKRNGQWYFDTKAGRQEILFRRIGENELDAIAICRGFVEAQTEYASEKRNGSEVNQYAQRIIATPGKQDGLAWRNADGTWGGPVGENIAKAIAEGYAPDQPGFHGYYFKVLKGQGSHAPLGHMNFVVDGVMIGGFALAAAPTQYRVTGVKTFIVSYEGIVYEKDLGVDTLKIFQNMELYDPDKTWRPTNDAEN